MGASHSGTSAAYYHNRSLVTGPTSSGDDDGGRQFAREILESCDPQLAEQYNIDGYLFPGSGRMMRTFRLRHKKNGSMVVVKLMWVSFDFEDDEGRHHHQTEDETGAEQIKGGDSVCDTPDTVGRGNEVNSATRKDAAAGIASGSAIPRGSALHAQQKELTRVFRALESNPHMAPFLYWKVGPEVFRPNYNTNNTGNTIAVRPALLLRPYFYTTLSDRLASRPFLTHVEKLWIVYQLLRALDYLHNSETHSDSSGLWSSGEDAGGESSGEGASSDSTQHTGIEKTAPIVHGFLTTENIGLSSWNWVVLLDLTASYKGRTALPDDDPSEYLYYFQERQTGSAQSNPIVNNNNADNYNNVNISGGLEQPSILSSASSSSSPMDTCNNSLANNQTREKRCYLAPERFYTPGTDRGKKEGTVASSGAAASREHPASKPVAQMLTPAMDIFSAGCVIMETFLNGERAFDLGDLMEYRQRKTYTPTLQQKLNKIEFSALRAACKNMLSLDPTQRLSAREYLDRLEASGLIPTSFEPLAKLMKEATTSADTKADSGLGREVAVVSPDARLAKAAACYAEILHETMGIFDQEGKEYFDKVLGRTAVVTISNEDTADLDMSGNISEQERNEKEQQNPRAHSLMMTEEKKESDQDTLFAETDALLKKLETLTIDEDEVTSMATEEITITNRPFLSPKDSEDSKDSRNTSQSKSKRSQLSESSLLIYLQLVLSTVRHVQRPASKLVALQIMKRIGRYSTDEARLQRIVPVAVSLLQDQDSLVRASAIEVLTSTISTVESFPPSDSKVFPQYIFKRVAHLVTDPSLVVRLAFARSVAVLAETAHRFLDISHAVRLYEAVGGGAAGENQKESASSSNVFGDDVAKLLGESASKSSTENPKSLSRGESTETGSSDITRTLISSTYNNDLGALHETVSRWVVHITTDVSEHSSPAKRVLLGDMGRLCTFFGLDGVMAFILPQILSFLNDRKDWQLRASLFEHLQSVCQFIGRAATEHFVLPILETALVDSEEVVISRAVYCLSELLRMGLVSRGLLLGGVAVHGSDEFPGLLQKYGTLILHPSSDIRFNLILSINAVCKMLGPLDAEVFVVPIIRPYLRFQPSMEHLLTPHDLEKCLYSSWTRERFQNELNRLLAAMESSSTAGQWTTIALHVNDGNRENPTQHAESPGATKKTEGRCSVKTETAADDHTIRFCAYLQMLARSRNYAAKIGSDSDNLAQDMKHAIEGSLKLAQQLKFPRQDITGVPLATLPQWYGSLLECRGDQTYTVRETAAIRSVSALGQVYGLSIMSQAVGAKVTQDGMTLDGAMKCLLSNKSKTIEAACRGEWGSETCLDPALTDTSLLLTKLNALDVPPLPPRLCEEKSPLQRNPHPGRQYAREAGDPRDSRVIWKPTIDNVIATSRKGPEFGHTAPVVRLTVSHDQRFFVSGSHDGTCRVWESDKAETSNGVLESSLTYSVGTPNIHMNPPRVNDLVMIEGSHSVASGGSDGSVHVWRVDLVSSSSTNLTDTKRDTRRVAGSTTIRTIHPSEGEVLAVNQFNNQGSSLLIYATQNGSIHSWDLRSAKEPFCLKNFQDTGYITNMAIGSDRNWVVVGTNRGYISLWDLRFQQMMKLWHHSRSTSINRLATSYVPPPQSWVGKRSSNLDSKPYIFVASGPNECAMFDATSGHCSECFRTVEYKSRTPSSMIDGVPKLFDVPLSSSMRRKSVLAQGTRSPRLSDAISSSFKSVNCMVGSTGNSDRSFLITGGSDRRIRFWDFSMPSKCHVTNGLDPLQPRPSFERIDYNNDSRLMLCHQAPAPELSEVGSSRVQKKLFEGTRAMPQGHHDSICDLKFLKNSLLSCSRDSTVKLWR